MGERKVVEDALSKIGVDSHVDDVSRVDSKCLSDVHMGRIDLGIAAKDLDTHAQVRG